MGNDIGMYRLSIGMFYIRAYSSFVKKNEGLFWFWYFELYEGNALFTEFYPHVCTNLSLSLFDKYPISFNTFTIIDS